MAWEEVMPRNVFCTVQDRIRELLSYRYAGVPVYEVRELVVKQGADRVAELEAEVKRLSQIPMRYRRMTFNAELQEEVNRLTAENLELRSRLSAVQGDTLHPSGAADN